jgi:hypothetical protein
MIYLSHRYEPYFFKKSQTIRFADTHHSLPIHKELNEDCIKFPRLIALNAKLSVLKDIYKENKKDEMDTLVNEVSDKAVNTAMEVKAKTNWEELIAQHAMPIFLLGCLWRTTTIVTTIN